MRGNYWVVTEKTNTGYSAFVPDLPGCVATGDSKESVLKLAQEAIAFHLEGLQLENLPIPQANAEATNLMVEW